MLAAKLQVISVIFITFLLIEYRVYSPLSSWLIPAANFLHPHVAIGNGLGSQE